MTGTASSPAVPARSSLRRQLLVGILLPVIVLVVFNSAGLYRQALRAADTAYDRTLLASAKSIGEQLEVANSPEGPHLRATLPYSALEPFEADNRSRIYYRVSGFGGEMVSGFEDLPAWRREAGLHPQGERQGAPPGHPDRAGPDGADRRAADSGAHL